MTSIILLLMSAVPCLQLQVTTADADAGIDRIELGEVAYNFRFPSDPQPITVAELSVEERSKDQVPQQEITTLPPKYTDSPQRTWNLRRMFSRKSSRQGTPLSRRAIVVEALPDRA
jgi:hypothetical protein